MIDIKRILKLLPHRYPFLMVDRVLELKDGEYIKAVKNVTFNEPHFTGHFPEDPVMPGVLIIEALAQAGALIALSQLSGEELEKSRAYFAGIERARFKRVVRPGDVLILEGRVINRKANFWKMEAKATVDGKVAAEAILQAAIVRED
ncbi:MAG: 3-hydroxyacyl-ACP dehydratase FabZ [Deferribacteres bacterium]|nr:3-hydroxyacyl-ACP dehydratase FabZ [Deferribacteres bacterium]